MLIHVNQVLVDPGLLSRLSLDVATLAINQDFCRSLWSFVERIDSCLQVVESTHRIGGALTSLHLVGDKISPIIRKAFTFQIAGKDCLAHALSHGHRLFTVSANDTSVSDQNSGNLLQVFLGLFLRSMLFYDAIFCLPCLTLLCLGHRVGRSLPLL